MAKWDVILNKAIQIKEKYNDVADLVTEKGAPEKTENVPLKFDVLEVFPDRDNKKDIYLLSGSSETLQLQTSLFLAIEELVSARTGNFNLKEWAENWCNEFPDYEGKYRPKDFKEKPWGLDPKEKPKLDIVESTGKVAAPYYVCQYFPNRSNDNEWYWMVGNAAQVINQIVEFTNFNRILNTKDFGEFYGYPVDEYYRMKPSTNTSIKLFFTNRKKPPYYKGSSTTFFYKGQVNIPNVDESKLTYENIRTACNADNGLVWGHWIARAYLSSHEDYAGINQMVCWGDDESTANANLDKFLAFSKSKVTSRTSNHIQSGTKLSKGDPWWEEKTKFDIYPRFMTVINPVKRAVDKNKPGKATSGGTFQYKRKRLFINQQIEPVGWSNTLKQVLSNSVK
ncbi:hypothetical protein H6F77_11630 [Microcoleus sp. FACHB-831]|uniref:hypothetical protein n=1 Tax=Microcoleus sp. FACHB-831 TaxID=2692827 RepID=UPI0016836419|nr:hypothetical protein [Microcoleus sp. FACHB-831]MBD1921742.1 hypothetical protein [Microcoleus sp. FACHB-831]